ncbi:unnamed protein product [Ascophyllum nodosum]
MATRSTRQRRKPENVYDTAVLATEEQRQLSEELVENPAEEAGRAAANPSSTNRGRGVGGETGGGRKAKEKGGAPYGRTRGRRRGRGGSEGFDDENDVEEEEAEKEQETEEQEDVAPYSSSGNRKSSLGITPAGRGKRRASTPPARNASKFSKTEPGSRNSAGGIDADDDAGENIEADTEPVLELEPEMSYSSAKLGRDEVGREEVLSAGIESENALLEAVTRSAALQTVVADWVLSFERGESAAMETLLNFLLLSCGAPCTNGPYTPPEGVDVNDMEAMQWAELMQEVADDIKQAVGKEGTGGSFPLAPAAKGKTGKAARAFRANFCEVFQRMSEACRRGTGHNTYALSAVVDLLVALSQQASDDVRFAATLGAMELGLGVAEGLSDLYTKLTVGQRQLDVATAFPSPRGRGGRGRGRAQPNARKTKALQDQVERISNAVAGLTDISEKVFVRVTQKRYRDVSTSVRTTVLEGLCAVMLALPEVYVEDKLMRYFGWSLSAKPPAVRSVALKAIQTLLKDETARVRLGRFSGHFFSRVKDMLSDVDPGICREAAIVLRMMLSAGFLENMTREDELEIERNIFETDLPLAARSECMSFFVDRLEEFVETDTERAAGASAVGGGGRQKPKGIMGKGKGSAGGSGSAGGVGGGGVDEDEEQIAVVRLESLAQLINLHANESSTDYGREGERAGEVTYQELLACADAAVQALWCLPQAPVVRRWSALCRLLDNEEAGGDRGERTGGMGGALDAGEQTVVARMMLTAAKMTHGEATTGRRKAGGWALGKDAKQEIRESMSELSEVCLTHLPSLLAKYQSDDAKLALLAELPVHLPRQSLAPLVSGVGKAAFSDLLSRTKDAFLMSNSSLVVDAAAASLRSFLEADHAKRAEVEAMVQGMMEELFSKAGSLCSRDENFSTQRMASTEKKKKGNDRAWRDTASSLAACLRRLRALVGGVDPSSRVTAAGLWELWEGVKDAVMRRCHLDEVLPLKTPPSQYEERLDTAREVVEEGCNVLYTLFLWQVSPLFDRLRLEGLTEQASFDKGDIDGASPPQKKAIEGDETPGLGDGALGMEEVTEETVQAIIEYRDGLVEALRGMLSIHLHPREQEPDAEMGQEGRVEGEQKHSQDSIVGTPRVLTQEQKLRLVGPARRAAWKMSNELQTVLKAFLEGVEGPLASLTWMPDTSFTCLLQEHFEAEEEGLITAWIRRKRRRSKEEKKGVAENGMKAMEEEGDDGEYSDGYDGEALEAGDDLSMEQAGRERELLMPLIKSIYSNVDRLNRRQAAAVVAHVVNSSPEAGALAKFFISKLKEHSPIRCLEVHMATMRVFYNKWVASPSREMGDVEEADSDVEKRRSALDEAGLQRWIPLVHRLAMSLGVGPLRSKDPTEQLALQDMFLRFMKEGVRFALHVEGERLLFLEGMREYMGKVPPRHRRILGKFFDQEARSLHGGVLDEGKHYASLWDNQEVQLSAVPPRWRAYFSLRASILPGTAASFIPENAGSMASSSPPSSVSIMGSSSGTPSSTRLSSNSGSRKTGTRPGSSIRSRMSAASELFPVEEGMEDEVDGDNNEKGGDGGDEADAPGSDQDHRHGSDDNYEGGSRLQRMMMRGSARGESDLLMGLQEENDEEGFEAGSVISEVHTPNRGRLDESVRLELERAEVDEASDLFEDLAFNPSEVNVRH